MKPQTNLFSSARPPALLVERRRKFVITPVGPGSLTVKLDRSKPVPVDVTVRNKGERAEWGVKGWKRGK